MTPRLIAPGLILAASVGLVLLNGLASSPPGKFFGTKPESFKPDPDRIDQTAMWAAKRAEDAPRSENEFVNRNYEKETEATWKTLDRKTVRWKAVVSKIEVSRRKGFGIVHFEPSPFDTWKKFASAFPKEMDLRIVRKIKSVSIGFSSLEVPATQAEKLRRGDVATIEGIASCAVPAKESSRAEQAGCFISIDGFSVFLTDAKFALRISAKDLEAASDE